MVSPYMPDRAVIPRVLAVDERGLDSIGPSERRTVHVVPDLFPLEPYGGIRGQRRRVSWPLDDDTPRGHPAGDGQKLVGICVITH